MEITRSAISSSTTSLFKKKTEKFPQAGLLKVEKFPKLSLKSMHLWEAASSGSVHAAGGGFCRYQDRDLHGDSFSPENSLSAEFCRNTSLHGLKYIGQKRVHLLEKIFWSIAFASALVIAAWMISAVWQKYLRSPVIVSFQPFETKTSEIPFPAITICNMNKILKSKADNFMREARGPWKLQQVQEARENVVFMDHVCAATSSFSKRFNFSVTRGNVPEGLMNQIQSMNDKPDSDTLDMTRFLEKSSQKCHDMVPLCIWQEETANCSQLFTNEGTDFGKCCTFNMMPKQLLYRNSEIASHGNASEEFKDWKNWEWDGDTLLTPSEEVKGEYPRRQKLPGKTFGLSILLNPDLHEYFCTTSDSVGFRLLAHSPIEVPRVVDFGNAIGPNSEVFINVKPTITVADEKIQTFRLSQRQCYFSDEFNLTFYEYYTSTNCLMECLANLTYEKCFCASYYMPRDTTRNLCSRSQYRCASDIKRDMVHRGYNSVCKQCLPSCTEIRYLTEITSVPLQQSEGLWEAGVYNKPKWARSNVSIVHIYFGDESTTARLRTELYGFTDLFANFGGLMGLCLGFSGLSLIEIIYFLTIRAFCRRRILSKEQNRLRQEIAMENGNVTSEGLHFQP